MESVYDAMIDHAHRLEGTCTGEHGIGLGKRDKLVAEFGAPVVALMRRLNFVVEGQTEEAFVNGVLRPHLGAIEMVATARCVTTRRDRRRPDIVHRGMNEGDIPVKLFVVRIKPKEKPLAEDIPPPR